MRASIAAEFLLISLAISGCGTLDHKTILLNVGDSKESVLKVMGLPQDRQVSGQQEAWQYCVSGAGFGWNDHKVVWFNAGHVTGINSYRSGVTGCKGGIQPVRWDNAPSSHLTSGPEIKSAIGATSSSNLVDIKELRLRVNMPPPIYDDIKRIALVHPPKASLQPELSGTEGKEARLSFQQIIANLRHVKAQMEVVERADLGPVISEMQFQMNGLVRDKDVVKVGHMLGVDYLFLYSIVLTTDKEMEYVKLNGGAVGAIVSGKILNVETGRIVYLESITQSVTRPSPERGHQWTNSQNDRAWALSRALKGLSYSLDAAFTPRDCGCKACEVYRIFAAHGIFVDSAYQGPGARVSLVLEASPGERVGIRESDVIAKVNGTTVESAQAFAELINTTPNLMCQGSIYTVRRGTDEKDYSVITK